jgi:UDP-N-acetylglucosamine 2-epimerase (non-hydrolysing)
MNLDVVFGTRPEWLKLVPVVLALQPRSGTVRVRTVFTGQQPDLVRPLLARWGFRPDVDLADVPRDLSLSTKLAHMLRGLDAAFAESPPDCVLVQGDTLSTFAGALAAYYRGIPFDHVEAGLRTFDLDNPFPEEFHRTVVGTTARMHYCPTPLARENLLQEGVPSARTLVTGNTSMDALRLAKSLPPSNTAVLDAVEGANRNAFLVTLHRRENLPLLETDILPAMRDLLTAFPDMRLIWVLRPGPAHELLRTSLRDDPRVSLVEPLDFVDILHILTRVGGVFTDSGGLSEECAALGVPTLVLRQATERVESLQSGNAALVGNRRQSIVRESIAVLGNPAWLSRMQQPVALYGDGHAAGRIVDHLLGGAP